MRIKFKGEKERHKFLVMAILLAGCCFLTYYFHAAISTGKFVTHFYYIPIILAALWWKRKGLAVAIFFAAWLIFSHFFIRPGEETIFDFFRAAMFVTVGFITVILREQIDKDQREIKREKNFSENIITAVPDSLIVVDKALRIKKANLSFYQVFGLKPENVEGTRIVDLLGDEDGKLSTELTRLIGTKTAIQICHDLMGYTIEEFLSPDFDFLCLYSTGIA